MQDFTLAPRARLAFAVLAIAGLGTASVIKLARGSDHQDTPDVELNPAADMTDVYAFPGASPGRTVLVLNSWRSEEHTSELQSQSNLVCRLLLEKKKNIKHK